MSDDEQMMIEGQAVSLADLANLSADDVAEVRFELFPEGLFQWRGIEAGFVSRGSATGINLECECVHVESTLKQDVDPATLPGKKKDQYFKIDPKEPLVAFGRAKAFCEDIGLATAGKTYDQIFEEFKAHYAFIGKVVHTVDKNDKDKKYANFGNNKGDVGPAAPHAVAATA